MSSIALFDAKNRLTNIVHQVENGEAVELTRHGKSVAVLMDINEYQKIKNSRASFSRLLAQFYTEWSMEAESMPGTNEIGDPFENTRARAEGREVDL